MMPLAPLLRCRKAFQAGGKLKAKALLGGVNLLSCRSGQEDGAATQNLLLNWVGFEFGTLQAL